MTHGTWDAWGATVSARCVRGIMHLDFIGPITTRAVAAFTENVRPRLEDEDQAYALIARYQQAEIKVSAMVLTAPLRHAERRGRMQLPGAVLCRPEDAEKFRQHALLSAELGVVRVVFTDALRAQVWAEDRASSARLATLFTECRVSPRRRSTASRRRAAVALRR